MEEWPPFVLWVDCYFLADLSDGAQILMHNNGGSVCVLLSVVAGAPPSVSVVVLGVGRVAAVSRGVGALILASLAPPPARRLAHRAPYSRVPDVHTPSFSAGRARLSRLAPAGGAVELVLSQQSGLDACRGRSQQVELL